MRTAKSSLSMTMTEPALKESILEMISLAMTIVAGSCVSYSVVMMATTCSTDMLDAASAAG